MSIYQDIESLIDSLESTDSTHEVDSFARHTAERLRVILHENRGDGSRMVRIEGRQLKLLMDTFDNARMGVGEIRLLRLDQRGDSVAFKINEGTWSPGLGTHQAPY